MSLAKSWEHLFGAVGLVLFLLGQYAGLFVSPQSADMGDVVRILYVHVPAAWTSLLAFTAAFVGAALWLLTSRRGFDYLLEAAAEVGVLTGIILCFDGAMFAKPTWNAFWPWDARLTTPAILILSFVGVLVLRGVVDDPDRRATWSAVATVFSAVNVPIVYFSVVWFRSIHQMQSTPDTLDSPILWVFRVNVFAFLFLATWLIARRWRLAKAHHLAAEAPLLEEVTP